MNSLSCFKLHVGYVCERIKPTFQDSDLTHYDTQTENITFCF